jgi:hypothetical protein
MALVKATKIKRKLRLALCGPTGAGKTYTALRIAQALGRNGEPAKVMVFDSENSANLYSDIFDFHEDDAQVKRFPPAAYVKAIELAEAEGMDVIILDTLSAAWQGPGGVLEMVDEFTERASRGNNRASAFSSGWKEVAPLENELITKIHHTSLHVIACMKSKMEYVMEAGGGGKASPKRVGMSPIQRAGIEYEFDVVGDLEKQVMCITKSRCPELTNAVIKQPGEAFAATLLKWLGSGIEPLPPQKIPPPEPPPTTKPEPKLPVPWSPEQRKAILAACYELGATDAPAIVKLVKSIDAGFDLPLTDTQAKVALHELEARVARIALEASAEAAARAAAQRALDAASDERAPGEPASSDGESAPASAPTPDASAPTDASSSPAAASLSDGPEPTLPVQGVLGAPLATLPEAKATPKAAGGADTRTLIEYVRALDTCTTVAQLKTTEDAHAPKLVGLRRNRSLADAYARSTALRIGVPDTDPLTDAERASLAKLDALRGDERTAAE